jgi:guanylate kinase
MTGKTPLLKGSGHLVVISGPSGVGKDTVLQRLFELDPSLRRSVSYTTREPREGEREGEPYTFVDEKTFNDMVERDEFLEWAIVYGHLYGTALRRVQDAVSRGEDIVLKIDVQGAARVRERTGRDATFIFLLPPSRDELRRRLFERAADDRSSLELRWANAMIELAEQDKYDHNVVNDDVDRAAREILTIVRSRRPSDDGAREADSGGSA